MTDETKNELASTSETPPAVVERGTVALIADGAEALRKLTSRTGLRKNDVINRALQVYEFVDAEIRAGNKIATIDPEGKAQLVKLI